MSITLDIRNESSWKGLVRRDVLQRLAERVLQGEGAEGKCELSVLFCDDAAIQELNKTYRDEDKPTDVLSFPQDCPEGATHALGDIVISLETVDARHPKDAEGARDEVKLLFCHGLLHLLGYDHYTEEERREMTARQAEYLRSPKAGKWPAANT